MVSFINFLKPQSSNSSLQPTKSHDKVPSSNPKDTEPLHVNDPKAPVKLCIEIESPPVVLYGPVAESTGSILCGILTLDIVSQSLSAVRSNQSLSATRSNQSLSDESDVVVESVDISLEQIITYGKPFLPNSGSLSSCDECRYKITEMKTWSVLSQPISFPQGSQHGFPFSHLIPGSVPATTILSNSNTTIRYELRAQCLFRHNKTSSIVKLTLPTVVKRSIPRGPDRNSLRVFPPTEVTATALLPNVIYAKSQFPLELRLDNLVTGDNRWRVRKVSWRIEETCKVRAHACKRHKTKLAVFTDHTRVSLQNRQKPRTSTHGIHGGPIANTHVGPDDDPGTSVSTDGANPTNVNSTENTHNTDTPVEGDSTLHPVEREELNQESHQIQEQNPQPTPKKRDSLFQEEIRVVGHGELKSGWKSDFSDKGRVELVADIDVMNLSTVGLNSSLNNLNHIHSSNSDLPIFHSKHIFGVGSAVGGNAANVSCDILDKANGIVVSHILIVEIMIAEEHMIGTQALHPTHSSKRAAPRFGGSDGLGGNHETIEPIKSNQSLSEINRGTGIPTGAARVLRMQFKVVLTERSGLGIAWDDEVPPVYDDVSKLCPPSYDQAQQSSDDLALPSFPQKVASLENLSSMRSTPVLNGLGVAPTVSAAIDERMADMRM